MATPTLKRAALLHGPAGLPSEAELRAFAAAAAQLLIEQRPRAVGARAVSRRPGVGLQHLDHRDYRPGDEVRHIDWRQTARRQQPIVRRFESESASDWTIVLDVSSSMALTGGALLAAGSGSAQAQAQAQAQAPKWRAAICMAAAIGYALLHLGHRVGLLAFGQQLHAQCPLGRGQHHYAALAQMLATLRPPASGEGSALGVCARHLQGATSVFVISDFLAEGEMGRDLTALLQRCSVLHALQVSDSTETRLPALHAGEAALDLVDVESGARQAWWGHPGADSGVVQQAAAERAAMTLRLRRFCAQRGLPFTDWPIDSPWQHALLAHLVRARRTC